ncbi:enoyl-CoA hydratase/isomerase family protein [Prescottella sp. R16]|uniref:enoyl-CoA hydratase/isomerase family protein n=1 Tax=Prescottella sp. R16 TaxID=3064529 RepID=UPI00272DE9D9|nr:enoyl-CoA hydratase/isomerase family protein [Prescottella sp. R16]
MSTPPATLTRGHTDEGADIAVLTFADGNLNLFGTTMLDTVADAVSTLVAHPPRTLLIRAEGKTVSAGVDVQVFDALSVEDGEAMWARLFDDIIHPVENLPCPTVFAAHALTLTAAFEIALACDIILAAPEAKFGLVERVVGLTPSMGGPQRLAERAGSGRARELVMTGDLYSAQTLADWGVVNSLHDDVAEAAHSLAVRLGNGPTRAHAATKQIIAAWRSGGVAHADSITPATSGSLFATSDLERAVQRFLTEGPRACSSFDGN